MTGPPELVEGCRDVCANNYVVMFSNLEEQRREVGRLLRGLYKSLS
jgi:hypothetical protein